MKLSIREGLTKLETQWTSAHFEVKKRGNSSVQCGLRLSFRETNPGFTALETPLSATLSPLGALFLVCFSLQIPQAASN